jgi:hypothetical protein
VQIAFGDDPKRADRRQRAALCAIDLVHSITITNRSPLASTWEIKILRENITRVAILVSIAITRAAAATKITVPTIVPIALAFSRIVPIPHVSILSTFRSPTFTGIALSGLRLASMDRPVITLQPIVGCRRFF